MINYKSIFLIMKSKYLNKFTIDVQNNSSQTLKKRIIQFTECLELKKKESRNEREKAKLMNVFNFFRKEIMTILHSRNISLI